MIDCKLTTKFNNSKVASHYTHAIISTTYWENLQGKQLSAFPLNKMQPLFIVRVLVLATKYNIQAIKDVNTKMHRNA